MFLHTAPTSADLFSIFYYSLPLAIRYSIQGSDKTTSGFDFDVCIVIGMSFRICLPNFVVIGRSAAELLPHIDFSNGGHEVGLKLPMPTLPTQPR